MLSSTALAGPAIHQFEVRDLSDSTGIYTIGVKWIVTILSIISATVVTITYGILIGPGTRLRSTSKLLLFPIEQNIGTILELAWPDLSNTTVCGVTGGLVDVPDAIRLLYLGKMGENKRRVARGLRQCEAVPDVHLDTPSLWLTSGSPITASIVQLAIWEWVFLWMNLAMVAATLLYNGFFTNELGTDGYVRLTLVLVYAVAYCVHAVYVWHAITTFFTMVSTGSAWSMLNKANFAIVDLRQYKERLSSPTNPLEFRLISKANPRPTPPSPIASTTISTNSEAHSEEKKALEEAQNTIKAVQERERDTATEAASTALERVVANGMVMAAVILSSGLATWTVAPADSDSTQLGSLGVLASLSLGATAMFTSAMQLTTMNSSYRQILLLKEVTINGHEIAYVKKRPAVSRGIGFIYGKAGMHKLRMRDMLKETNWWGKLCFLLFGPAYALLLSEEDAAMESAGTQWELTAIVRDETVVLTTGGTNRHNRDDQNASVEAINVCFRPASTHANVPAPTTPPLVHVNVSPPPPRAESQTSFWDSMVTLVTSR
ncbi:hypothetical protein K439DRAFT_1419596 [Ramaria rubella]|nr:hypothetical protein K439DRAFT_1419596 [Ramaria rubella]